MRLDNSSNLHGAIKRVGLGLVIVVALAACAPTAAPASVNSIQGVVWQWTSVTEQATKKTLTVPNPEVYTIIFNADGTLTGKADCNNFSGTYSQQNGFTIKLGPSTMAFCGETSLDQQYLQLLGKVAAGGPDGAGGLALETAGGAERMMFKNGGPAPSSQGAPAATPTIDPAIYNQVPTTTMFEPGQCKVTLNAPAPAYTSNTLGGQPSGQIPAGTYDTSMTAQYSTSLWYALNNVGAANYVNSTSVSSTSGNCGSSSSSSPSSSNPLANTKWQVTDYANPKNTTGMSTVLPATTLTAEFSADNKIAGSAGCNNYSGTYQVQGESLTIPGPLATTMMMCPEDVMAQEQAFLANLQAVAGYKLESVEPQLHLLNSKGQVTILLKKQ